MKVPVKINKKLNTNEMRYEVRCSLCNKKLGGYSMISVERLDLIGDKHFVKYHKEIAMELKASGKNKITLIGGDIHMLDLGEILRGWLMGLNDKD